MSFAKNCKNELSRVETNKNCCKIAELAAFVHLNGNLDISGDVTLKLETENPAIARRVFRLFKLEFQQDMEILMRQKMRLHKSHTYSLSLSGKDVVKHVLTKLGLATEPFTLFSGVNQNVIGKRCCKRAYLRGAFLARGSIANPEQSHHLEISADYEGTVDQLISIMKNFGLKGGKIDRKKDFLLYIKDSEQICDFLNVIGAHKTLMDYENIRIMKGMRNQINRLVNCETANLHKTAMASLRQAENIKLIDEAIGLTRLPLKLQEVALKRVSHPEASLKELGQMLNPPVGKSGVNHRLRKIEEIAESLRKGEEPVLESYTS